METWHRGIVILEILRIDWYLFRGLINCTFIKIKLDNVRYVCHNRVEELRTLVSTVLGLISGIRIMSILFFFFFFFTYSITSSILIVMGHSRIRWSPMECCHVRYRDKYYRARFLFFLRTDTGILKVTSTHLPAVPVDNFCQVPAGFSYSFLNIYKRQERFENEGLPDKKNFDIFASIANHWYRFLLIL